MDALTLISQNTGLFFSAIFIMGLLVGSFLNVVIYRLPEMLKSQWSKDCKLFLAENGDLKYPRTPRQNPPITFWFHDPAAPTAVTR